MVLSEDIGLCADDTILLSSPVFVSVNAVRLCGVACQFERRLLTPARQHKDNTALLSRVKIMKI